MLSCAASEAARTCCVGSGLRAPLKFLKVRLPLWKQQLFKVRVSLSKPQRKAYQWRAVISFVFVLCTRKKVL